MEGSGLNCEDYREEGKKMPQAIRRELCSIFLAIASAGPVGLTFEVGSGAWGKFPWATHGKVSHTVASQLLHADPCGYWKRYAAWVTQSSGKLENFSLVPTFWHLKRREANC